MLIFKVLSPFFIILSLLLPGIVAPFVAIIAEAIEIAVDVADAGADAAAAAGRVAVQAGKQAGEHDLKGSAKKKVEDALPPEVKPDDYNAQPCINAVWKGKKLKSHHKKGHPQTLTIKGIPAECKTTINNWNQHAPAAEKAKGEWSISGNDAICKGDGGFIEDILNHNKKGIEKDEKAQAKAAAPPPAPKPAPAKAAEPPKKDNKKGKHHRSMNVWDAADQHTGPVSAKLRTRPRGSYFNRVELAVAAFDS